MLDLITRLDKDEPYYPGEVYNFGLPSDYDETWCVAKLDFCKKLSKQEVQVSNIAFSDAINNPNNFGMFHILCKSKAFLPVVETIVKQTISKWKCLGGFVGLYKYSFRDNQYERTHWIHLVVGPDLSYFDLPIAASSC